MNRNKKYLLYFNMIKAINCHKIGYPQKMWITFKKEAIT